MPQFRNPRRAGDGSPKPGSAQSLAAALLPEVLDLQIEHISPDQLKPYPGNPRTHTAKKRAKMRASILNRGFVEAITIDPDNTIVDGHCRFAVAKELGLSRIPVNRIRHLSPAEIRTYRLAANKLAMESGWDEDLLPAELQSLEGLQLNTPLELTGFDGAELDRLLDHKPGPKSDKDDRIPEGGGPIVTCPGDVFLLGPHKLHCGDACTPASYDALMGDERAQMVFADGPYNCPIDGYVGGKGKTKRREFIEGAGELSDAEFEEFQFKAMAACAAVSVDGAIHFQCMDWKGYPTLVAAAARVYAEQKNLIVWVKSNAGMGSFYRSRHELVGVFKVGTATHRNNFGLGETGRWRSNVWEYPGMNAFGRGRDETLALHSTCKPVAMVADAIKDVSARNEIVLDPFGGSGTTLIAAQKTGRRARLLELDPWYCDVICRRWEAFTGRPAVLEATGETFNDLKASRTGAPIDHQTPV